MPEKTKKYAKNFLFGYGLVTFALWSASILVAGSKALIDNTEA